MKEVLVLRHAKAEAARSPLEDHSRDLAPRGIQAAEAVGRLITAHKLVPQLLFCSDALRARRTAELAVLQMEPTPQIEFLPELYSADPHDYFTLLQSCRPETSRVMIVAHNPTIEGFLGEAGGHEPRMKTAALALLRFHTELWSDVAPGGAAEPALIVTDELQL